MSPIPTATACDCTEWFADPWLTPYVTARHWRRLPARAVLAVRLAAARLREAGRLTTFFVTGAMARREPGLLAELAADGHELALLAMVPCALDAVPAAERHELLVQWQRDAAAIESAGGAMVHGFRASWPIGEGERWWRGPLAALDFAYDASSVVEPDRTDRVSISALDGRQAAVRIATVACLDDGVPRLANLPRRAQAELLRRRARLRSRCDDLPADGPIATALGLQVVAPARRPVAEEVIDAPSRLAPDAVRLTVVVPLKDEENGVEALFRELDLVATRLAAAAVAEVDFVVVDDGSTDRTWALLQQEALRRPRVRLVQHPHNRGVAAAIQTGIRASDAPWVASIDGDLSYDPLELAPMLRLAMEQRADVVTASPYHRAGRVLHVPAWRLSLSRGLSWLYRLLLRRPIRTWTACFRVYRREAVAELPLVNGGFLGTVELLVRVLRRGGVVLEHPCTLEARLLGFSKMRVVRTVFGHLRLLGRVLLGRVR